MFNPEEYADKKWGQPGWKIEQCYKTNVLIGNWNEERRKFERSASHYNSTNRTDFKNFGKQLPDVKTRRLGMLRTEGHGKDYIFSHHGDAYKGNTITWYDQQFNKRELAESGLPPLRSWESRRLVWEPEKSDFPLQGPPTNFGLLEKKKAEWKKAEEQDKMSIYTTTNKLSYFPHQRKSYSYRHFATPRFISTNFHPHRINKDLHFRGKAHLTPCEYPPVLSPVS